MHKGITLLLGGIYEAALAAAATAAEKAARDAVAAARAAEAASLQSPVTAPADPTADPTSTSPHVDAHPRYFTIDTLPTAMSTTTPPCSPQYHTAPDGTEMQMDTPKGDSKAERTLAEEIAQEKRRLHLLYASAGSPSATPAAAAPASRRRSFPSTTATAPVEHSAAASSLDTTTGTAAGAAAAAASGEDVVGLQAWSSMVSMLIRVAWDVGRLWGTAPVVGPREQEILPGCDSLLVRACFLLLGRLLETHPHLLDVFLNDPR